MTEQSLSLHQDQRQIQMLAPQLRQSLEMLQAPVLELRKLIQNELQQNPTLEELIPEAQTIDIEQGGGEIDDAKELNFEKEFEVLARIDDEWRDYFMQEREYEPADRSRAEKRDFFFNSQAQADSLQDHLLRQLRLSELSEDDQKIGELIIGSINSDGYLVQKLGELAESADINLSRAQDVLSVIQEFDPVGVGAGDLKDCLLIQLERLGHEDSLAARIVMEHLDLLAARRHDEIARAVGVSADEVLRAATLIATLEPRPGRPFDSESPVYILPEILVEKVNGKYVVILDDDQVPRLRISREYRRLLRDEKTTGETKEYIKSKMRAGMFLIKSIEQRKRTLRKVAEDIVSVQGDFLDSGVSGLRPLTMAEVAGRTGVHETTVSRCIANKHMKTPRGVFEMKYFFTPGIKTSDGRELSNKTVKDTISSILSGEDPSEPLSDHDITERLRGQGILIARRTVAKYRIALKIPPSHLRKQ